VGKALTNASSGSFIHWQISRKIVSFWSKLPLVLSYFCASVYIFATSLISFIVRGLAKGPFGGSRGSGRSLALALCGPVLAGAVIDSKGVAGSKGV
jgi:hypothetical protein